MATEGAVRLAFLPAYYRDCGWTGVKCLLPFVNCRPHVGDSEYVVVDVVRADDRRWRVIGIFLSAHCFAGSDPACRWYRGSELASFRFTAAPMPGAPIVWVAEGRQANYPSRAACGAGHSSIDTCDRNVVEYRFPIRNGRQNIGSSRRPAGTAGGCLTGRALNSESSRIVPEASECFWRPGARFGGWQADSAAPGTTPYERYLRGVAHFTNGSIDRRGMPVRLELDRREAATR